MVGVAIYQAYRKVLQTNRNLIVCLTRGGAAINDLALGRRSEAAIALRARLSIFSKMQRLQAV